MDSGKNKKKKVSRAGLGLMILGALITAGGLVLLMMMPEGFDYVIPAPAFSTDMPVQEQLERLEDVMETKWAAALRQQGLTVSSGGADAKRTLSATVYAVSEGYFDIAHETLKEGRLLNRTDLDVGTVRALINRKGAESLFTGGDAVGKTLLVGGVSAEIAGITEGGFRPGESDEILVFLPITAANTGKIAFGTMEIKTRAAGREEKALAAATLKNWNADGTVQDSSRIRLAALMPLWLMACAAGFWILKLLLRAWRKLAAGQREKIKAQMTQEYAGRVVPRAIPRVLLVVLLGALWLGGVWLLLLLIAEPLYTFTDWIPESPADPASIAATARNLLQGAAASAVWKNRAAGTAEAAAALIRAGCLVLLCGLVPFRRVKKEI